MSLKFLDIRLWSASAHVNWSYEPRANKSLLPFSTGHSKLVRTIAKLTLMDVLHHSCFHKCQSSFLRQIEHLKSTEYSQSVITSVAKWVLRIFKHGCLNTQTSAPQKEGEKKEKGVVVPYIYVSHRLLRSEAKMSRLSSQCQTAFLVCAKPATTKVQKLGVRQSTEKALLSVPTMWCLHCC